jgi:hypothetical protein
VARGRGGRAAAGRMFSATEAVMRRDWHALRARQGKVSLCVTDPDTSKGDRAMAGLQNDAGEGVSKAHLG